LENRHRDKQPQIDLGGLRYAVWSTLLLPHRSHSYCSGGETVTNRRWTI
jgi:hypothetical protein